MPAGPGRERQQYDQRSFDHRGHFRDQQYRQQSRGRRCRSGKTAFPHLPPLSIAIALLRGDVCGRIFETGSEGNPSFPIGLET